VPRPIHLTPVTLELGGKSPAIVSAEVPLKDAARRIAWGKSLNAGQTCIAPDYVLVPKTGSTGLSRRIARPYSFLSDAGRQPGLHRHHQRAPTGAAGAFENRRQRQRRTPDPALRPGPGPAHAPCLLLNVNDEMQVMQEEIFGPLLPDRAVSQRSMTGTCLHQLRPRPLALYYFGYNKAEQQRVIEDTHSGGVCMNDTLLHVAIDDLPFGGVGLPGWAATTVTKGF
jgi:coniferyl-aldehyde dehydrogenase